MNGCKRGFSTQAMGICDCQNQFIPFFAHHCVYDICFQLLQRPKLLATVNLTGLSQFLSVPEVELYCEPTNRDKNPKESRQRKAYNKGFDRRYTRFRTLPFSTRVD